MPVEAKTFVSTLFLRPPSFHFGEASRVARHLPRCNPRSGLAAGSGLTCLPVYPPLKGRQGCGHTMTVTRIVLLGESGESPCSVGASSPFSSFSPHVSLQNPIRFETTSMADCSCSISWRKGSRTSRSRTGSSRPSGMEIRGMSAFFDSSSSSFRSGGL